MSRSINTTRNLTMGLIDQSVGMILNFFNKTVIIYYLGVEFAGLNNVYTSILHILNIAELGFNTAIVYSLYEPIAKRDIKKIRELMADFREIYRIIGTVILILGLFFTPFISRFVSGYESKSVNIYCVYLLYLINSVLSYFLFAYREVIIIADQRRYVSSLIRMLVNALKNVIQILVIIYWRDFYLYVIIAIFFTIITNLTIGTYTSKKYSAYYSLKKKKLYISVELRKQVTGLFINKICDICRNSFDTLIISYYIGLIAVAIYGNYYYIYSAIYTIMLVICNAMQASVGNAIAVNDLNSNYKQMLRFNFIYSWLSGWFTVCLYCLYQPFMNLWVGEELLLSEYNKTLFCIYFYVINMNNIRNMYVSGNGMWWKLKKTYILETVFNLLLNVILGKYFGISGVLWATIITIFTFNFLLRTHILFREYFGLEKITVFLLDHLHYGIILLININLVNNFSCLIDNFIFKIIICVIMPNVIFGVAYCKKNYLRECFKMGAKIIKELSSRKSKF